MKAKFVRGQDPKSSMGLGIISKFDEFAKNASMRRAEPDSEDLEDFENPEDLLAKWQQYHRGKFYSGYLILFRDDETGELSTFINSEYDEDVYPLDHWMAQPVWTYHFNS